MLDSLFGQHPEIRMPDSNRLAANYQMRFAELKVACSVDIMYSPYAGFYEEATYNGPEAGLMHDPAVADWESEPGKISGSPHYVPDYVYYDYGIHPGSFSEVRYVFTPAKFRNSLPEGALGPMTQQRQITIQQLDSILHSWGAKRIDSVERFVKVRSIN